MAQINPSDVHYRLIHSLIPEEGIVSVCVQDFDYYDYEGRWASKKLYATREKADKAIEKKIKKWSRPCDHS